MKLFQRLLVAPAALGLMAPIASAAEINLNGISDYAPPTQEFQAVSELSDIHPNDWTFQALTEIRNTRGCNVSLPQGVITRIEAAALLNKCIGDASQLNEAELRLIDEFGPELATIKGTADVLNTYSFEAGSFSTTTKMSGYANFLVGGVDGTMPDGNNDTGALHGFYGYGLDLNTSFSGEDLLYAGITQGNFDSTNSALGDMDMSDTGSSLSVSSLFYSFPLGDTTITAGPLVDQDDVVSVTTSLYSDAFKLSANPYTLPGNGGHYGAAISYANENGFNIGASFVSTEGTDGSGSGGILTSGGDDITTIMAGYDGQQFGGGLILTSRDGGTATTNEYEAFGGGIWYRPDSFPATFSFTYDTKDPATSGEEDLVDYLFGVDWEIGPGTVSFAVSNVPDSDSNDEDETSWELYYSYPVSDNLTITPGIFFIEGDNATGSGQPDDQTGIAINTNFVF